MNSAQRKAIRRAAENKRQATNFLSPAFGESASIPDEGNKRFTIGYQHYREDLCKIKSMPIASIRKVFEQHKGVGKCFSERDIYNLPFDVKQITLRGHYTKYASKLSPDVELNEFDAGSYRGFFYIDRTNRVIEMVAVDYHPEDKKQKRS